ncbi:MAG: HEAT repeat domain-containing protein [Myxacorys californica WJT36-NPBG1]|nr:HEAT repeat domain-containing protein [Myxacorys californica WJT36-NPBG1]
MRNPTEKTRSLLLKLAFLGFAIPLFLANSPAVSQSNPSASPTVRQSLTPQPSPSAESKKSEESTSAEDKKKAEGEKKQELPREWVAAIVGSAAVGYLFVLWLRPRWLLLIPSNFKTPKIGPIPELSPSILHFFQYRDRVLDAWVSDRIEKAREEFDRRQTVEERKIHISMPVVLDGKTVTGLTAKDLGKTCSKQEFRLLIWGEGGAGKTHLACLIAKWAMAEQKEARLCNHRMLPVLIEEELEEPKDTSTNKSPLLDAITRQLKNLRDDEKPIPEELLKKLLEKRRVLVVVDHLSEMSEATRKAIRFRDASFPVNALVVTSRLEDILGKELNPVLAKPMRVDGKQLSIFMDDYLKAKGKRELFEDDQYFDYLRRLSLIVTDTREITLLFAKLYADQMIAVAEGQLSDELPKNVPDLMLSYVNELNRNVREGKLEDATVQQNLKLIAWECVQQTFKPETANRQEVLTRLAALVGEGEAAKETAKQHLKYLEERLFLIRTVKPANQRLRVSLDPLAEYLAGLYLVEQYRNDEEAWRSFLAEAAEKPGTLEEIRGFLLAVRECCLVKAAETKVPSFVAEELGRLAGLDLEALEQEQLNRRIRYLISDLSRPEVADRLHAIESIGEIGSAAKFAAPAIVKILKDLPSNTHYVVAETLGELGNPSEAIVQELISLLNSDSGAYYSAVYALGKLGNGSEAVVQRLVPLLNAVAPDMRSAAAWALGRLGNSSNDVVKRLILLLDDDAPIASGESFVCSTAAEALGELGNASEEVLQGLLSLLDDYSPVCLPAVGALGKLGCASEDVLQGLLRLLNAEYDDVRSSAARALGTLGNSSEPVLQGLLLLLEDHEATVRRSAAQALGTLGNSSEPVLQELLTRLGDDELGVRYRVAEAVIKLGCVNNKDVISVLQTLSQHNFLEWRDNAKEILNRIASQENSAQD